MYNKILVPLDGSKRAEAILPHVEEIAGNAGAALVMLQVVDPPLSLVSPYDMMPSHTVDEIQDQVVEAEEYLADLHKSFQKKEIEAEVVVEYGAVVATIIEVAQEYDVDLVAMASHGRTGLSRVFYGSVAAGVLQRIDRPLLLIRA
jgi:nucleotide-binding universal stress UspA family protein